jgi:ADP-ribose pyrophosphatase YjhB (NUDIX family)
MSSFNIRVYGILLNNNKVLVSDEIIKGKFFTKFPGGGLEFGEGTRDCLKREFKEETGLDVTVGNHLYTTDYFQPSAFHSAQQIISIYYYVKCDDLSRLSATESPYQFSDEQLSAGKDCEVFRWIDLNEVKEADITLPIDRKVVSLLIKS